MAQAASIPGPMMHHGKPRELGTHLRIGELVWTSMEGMDWKEESRAFSATGE